MRRRGAATQLRSAVASPRGASAATTAADVLRARPRADQQRVRACRRRRDPRPPARRPGGCRRGRSCRGSRAAAPRPRRALPARVGAPQLGHRRPAADVAPVEGGVDDGDAARRARAARRRSAGSAGAGTRAARPRRRASATRVGRRRDGRRVAGERGAEDIDAPREHPRVPAVVTGGDQATGGARIRLLDEAQARARRAAARDPAARRPARTRTPSPAASAVCRR